MAWASATNLFTGSDGATSSTAPTTNHDANWGNAAQSNSNIITLNAGESAQIFIAATSHATGTSDLQFRVLTSPDGGTTWDTIPYMSGSIGMVAVNTLHSRTITVYGVKCFKLQFAPSLAYAWTMKVTGTGNSVYIKDGISA